MVKNKRKADLYAVQNIGMHDAVIGGDIYQELPTKSVLVAQESDLDYLSEYEPGTFAHTAGFVNIWEKGVDGTWVSLLDE